MKKLFTFRPPTFAKNADVNADTPGQRIQQEIQADQKSELGRQVRLSSIRAVEE